MVYPRIHEDEFFTPDPRLVALIGKRKSSPVTPLSLVQSTHVKPLMAEKVAA